jgi:hypothetical protein
LSLALRKKRKFFCRFAQKCVTARDNDWSCSLFCEYSEMICIFAYWIRFDKMEILFDKVE